ncbi:hypothetical protein ABL78_4434 [Leptomonas seymouri]|uniref:Uncharacterized protein n=1 Tax=Leptomonas seymouri TaxID=5684 RepID=A0A0N1HWL2_LEPSE|nr:hypothetical protein ABL78_4434 [Leptomonas seymouri]|eukprot:KPI86494.1 hypothetical protein ABL78_4434 [Leptomonas seymouri]
MINSYIQNSSAMSTEDGSSSTVYGGPQPPRAPSHLQDHRNSPPYTRQPRPDYFSNIDEPSAVQRKSDNIDINTLTRRSGSPRVGGRVEYRHIGGGNNHNYRASGALEGGSRYYPETSVRSDKPALQQQQRTIAEQSHAMLEVVLPVSTQLPSQEAQLRPLGLYVRAGCGGPNGVTRLVLVRLTDPADPFFLYELELLEDDYGAFKQRLELHVDFQGFPRYLVSMLRDITDGSSHYELSFVLHAAATAADGSRGTLRVLEATEFKTVEHISLMLLRQGDAGLKKYLAERFQFYEHSFRSAEAARAAITADLQEQVDRLRNENGELRDTLRKREEDMRFMTTDAEKEKLAALNRLRDQHSKDSAGLRESYEKKLEAHMRALEEKTQQLHDTAAEKDAALAKLRARVAELETNTASLQSQLRSAQDTGNLQAKELETLREMSNELANFKAEATKAMSENELNYVTLTERLRGTSTALQNREEKVAALQEHYEKQDEYIRILAEQNKQQADRVRETEKNLEKAHHIIANQLQTIKNARDRYHIATDQLRSQEALLQEREGTMRRQQDEVATANERIQELLRKNNDLRGQLEKTNSAREQLVQEVKQTQQVLLRLQQSTSINGRHWGVLSSTGGYRSGSLGSHNTGGSTTAVDDRYAATTGAPASLMREFGANVNANVMGPSNYRNTSASAAMYRSSAGVAPMSSPMGSTLPGSQATYPSQVEQGGPSLFHAHPMPSSPSPAHSSQERAGSSETAGLTEPHGRASTSSLAKTEPSLASSNNINNRSPGSAPAARRAQSLARSLSLDKAGAAASNSNAIVPSAYNDLAVKSFLNGDVGQTAVAAGTALESAYF